MTLHPLVVLPILLLVWLVVGLIVAVLVGRFFRGPDSLSR